MVRIDTSSPSSQKFFIRRITEINSGCTEKYQLSLEWYPNGSPVPDAIKDFMCHTEIKMAEGKYLSYEEVPRGKAAKDVTLTHNVVGDFKLGYTQYLT